MRTTKSVIHYIFVNIVTCQTHYFAKQIHITIKYAIEARRILQIFGSVQALDLTQPFLNLKTFTTLHIVNQLNKFTTVQIP